MRRRLIKPWLVRVPRKLSLWGRHLFEKQRVRFHYNLKNKTIKRYMVMGFERGNEYPIDKMLQICESRLSNVVWRIGLQPTMGAAHFFVSNGHVQIRFPEENKWRTCITPSERLKKGTAIRIKRRRSSREYARRMHEEEPRVELPDHIAWDWETLTGSYDDVCNIHQLGIEVYEDYLMHQFSGPNGIRHHHTRYFPGTTKPIPKRKHMGPRPTPENILNMKKGSGLNARGRRRPPCLWGRAGVNRKPLNNPYEHVSADYLRP